MVWRHIYMSLGLFPIHFKVYLIKTIFTNENVFHSSFFISLQATLAHTWVKFVYFQNACVLYTQVQTAHTQSPTTEYIQMYAVLAVGFTWLCSI